MEHFYNNIDGWFTSHKLYSEMVDRFPNGARFVEIGAWKGRSSAYMAVEIINSKKDIKFHAVDSWEWSEEYGGEPLMQVKDAMYNHFIENIRPVSDVVQVHRGYSHLVASQFEDESLDFVFVDAAHDYDNVVRDIISWLPKIKKTGVLAGHDADRIPVQQAVHDTLGQYQKSDEDIIWFIEKSSLVGDAIPAGRNRAS